jgi:hypothetical protein
VGGASSSAIPSSLRGIGPDNRSRLSLAVAQASPVVLARERLLEVPAPLAGMLPDGGLRRGSTLTLRAGDGTGCTSLALALTALVTQSGSWVAAVGLPSLGLVAAAQLGAALDHVALVPAAGAQWPVVAAALLDCVDVLLLAPGGRVLPADARRLSAKARERGAVMMVFQPPARTPAVRTAATPTAATRAAVGSWPEVTDLHLAVSRTRWDGLERGSGHLQARVVDVVVTGRRAAARARTWQVWLPGPDGRVAAVPSVTGPGVTGSGVAGSGVAGPGVAGPGVTGELRTPAAGLAPTGSGVG